MTRVTRIRLSIAVLTCLPFVSVAQTSGEGEVPVKRVDFSVYSLNQLQGVSFLAGDREGGTPVEFLSSARSQVYEYEGSGPIVFYTEETDDALPLGTPQKRVPIGFVDVPAPGGEYLFIFFRNEDADSGELPYRIYPLRDSKRDLPPDSIRFFNATDFDLVGKVGNKRVSFPPGPSDTYRVRNQISVGLGFMHEGEFHMSFNSPLQLESGSRGLLLIFPPFVKGSAIVQTRFIRQAPDAEDPTETSTTPPLDET